QLARAGLPHLLVERSRETGDALCGGFLSWRTLAMLERMGIAADTLNPAVVTRVRLFAGEQSVEAQLPFPARGVSRRTLDTALLAAAAKAGAAIERGVGVRAIDGGQARLDAGGEIAADALFLASGKHEVRGRMRPVDARGQDPTIGLRLRLAASPALDRQVGDRIELHLVDRGYAGLVRQEDGSGNLCMAVRRSRLREAGDPERLLVDMARELPALGDRLAHRATGSAVDAVANVPYGWRAAPGPAGLFRLGDQAAVIPSIAGEGMAIAIASALAASDAYARHGPAGSVAFQRRLSHGLARPVGMAGAVWHLAERSGWAGTALWVARHQPALVALVARLTRIDRQ
ncbi:FAD-binding monooxygenase, partial [Sphingomonas sp.]|uniref:NAD(P)/FAD-dependent oxidoreductase n=1 Tax=Sphingomonas sp. TaxID=28214 RepID=UPI002CC7CAC2